MYVCVCVYCGTLSVAGHSTVLAIEPINVFIQFLLCSSAIKEPHVVL